MMKLKDESKRSIDYNINKTNFTGVWKNTKESNAFDFFDQNEGKAFVNLFYNKLESKMNLSLILSNG